MNYCLKGWVKFVHEGHEDFLYNPAGGSMVEDGPVTDGEMWAWDRPRSLDLLGTFLSLGVHREGFHAPAVPRREDPRPGGDAKARFGRLPDAHLAPPEVQVKNEAVIARMAHLVVPRPRPKRGGAPRERKRFGIWGLLAGLVSCRDIAATRGPPTRGSRSVWSESAFSRG